MHPRLLLHDRLFERAQRAARNPLVHAAATRLAAQADEYLTGTDVVVDETQHNYHLIRARRFQGRIVTLLVRWRLSGETRYRSAAMAHLRVMERWPYWSWIVWRQRDRRPDAIFDLSYGENSATLALAWDLLHETLSPPEKAWLLRMARRWPVAAFLTNHARKTDWWFGKPDSNWNTVCAGGLGMLALAMWEELPEAPELLERVNESFEPYMLEISRYQGGWPEGIGYWGYGMRYAFMYLLSYEHAMQRKHPLMKLPGVKRTLDFPLDFSPHGVPCSFGDVNRYRVMPFHYLLAERFDRPDVIARLDSLQPPPESAFIPDGGGWPEAAELLLFHPGVKKGIRRQTRYLRHYPRLDWFALADRWPEPRLYTSIRGGTTEVPHGHLDLTSFHLAVGDEPMIVNLGNSEYLDTTFSARRYELFELAPPSKNVLLLNGVGICRPAKVRSRALRIKGYPAVRVDATEAMGTSRSGERAVRFYARLFVLLDHAAILIIDHVELRHFGRFETRFHSYARIDHRDTEALLQGDRHALRILFAADIPSHTDVATDAMTSPGPSPTLLRWRSDHLHSQATMAALMIAGGKPGTLTLDMQPKELRIDAAAARRRLRLRLSHRLLPR